MKKGGFSILICILMIVSAMLSISAKPVFEQVSYPLKMGNILYVGGSGPNNFTKIQNAIDVAKKGDTIFVYGGTYFENLIIEQSITLQGEDKNTTIIDGQDNGNVIFCSAFFVTIQGFTIQNGGNGHYAGVWLENAYFTKIEGNVIRENHYWGICFNSSSFNTVSGNFISKNNLGVEAGGDPWKPSNGNVFKNNVFTSNDNAGIGFGWSKFNLFYQNVLSNSGEGIQFWHNTYNVIYKNEITNTTTGIELSFSRQNIILCNNFQENQQDVKFFIDKVYQRNLFLGNYWNASSQHFHIIHGGFLALNRSFNNPIPWIQFDFFPAQEPYNIS